MTPVKPVKMCDKATRVWCCRIGLVLAISAVLLTMMFQIWSYYFSLVREMDALTYSEPKLGAIVSVCNQKMVTQWNMDCSENGTHWHCADKVEGRLYVDSSCDGHWRTINVEACCRTMVWILPW
jgi:hypothetical protein